MPFDPAVPRERRRTAGAPRRRSRGRRDEDGGAGRFYLYVEGPRDGEILRVWARRLSPVLARPLERCTVILGGRRPARAVEHFRDAGGGTGTVRGLVVLDRDHHGDAVRDQVAEPGLELFTWGRRHIESYVLVREAIRRAVKRAAASAWVDRLIEGHVPHAADEDAFRDIDAKRLLGAKGELARGLGHALSAATIARAMRPEELHEDVLDLYDRIRDGLGLAEAPFQVVRRSTSRRP
jgi:hypothetical protein